MREPAQQSRATCEPRTRSAGRGRAGPGSPVGALLLGLLLPLAAWAQDGGAWLAAGSEESFLGTESVVPPARRGPPPGEAQFDDAASFLPLSRLPVVDVYAKAEALLPVDERARLLETVSITPQGVVSVLAPGPEVIRLLAAMDPAAPQGLDPVGAAGAAGDSDLAADEAPAETVEGIDARVQVIDTTRYPFRAIGRIDHGCTGTLIGPRHVLTAGHCVYNIADDKWYARLSFSPGQNGGARPYGRVGWVRAVTVRGWSEAHRRDYDFAMIVLSKEIGHRVGWMGYGWESPMPPYRVNVNGYPGDKPFGTLWHSFCTLQGLRAHRLYYACDTYGAMSGAAVYTYLAGENKRTVLGLHTDDLDPTGLNAATRISRSVFETLRRWKSEY